MRKRLGKNTVGGLVAPPLAVRLREMLDPPEVVRAELEASPFLGFERKKKLTITRFLAVSALSLGEAPSRGGSRSRSQSRNQSRSQGRAKREPPSNRSRIGKFKSAAAALYQRMDELEKCKLNGILINS